jgi:hypothetical protein
MIVQRKRDGPMALLSTAKDDKVRKVLERLANQCKEHWSLPLPEQRDLDRYLSHVFRTPTCVAATPVQHMSSTRVSEWMEDNKLMFDGQVYSLPDTSFATVMYSSASHVVIMQSDSFHLFTRTGEHLDTTTQSTRLVQVATGHRFSPVRHTTEHVNQFILLRDAPNHTHKTPDFRSTVGLLEIACCLACGQAAVYCDTSDKLVTITFPRAFTGFFEFFPTPDREGNLWVIRTVSDADVYHFQIPVNALY